MAEYRLPRVKPHVKAAADELGTKYGIRTIHGWRLDAVSSDHPDGLALDFMTSDKNVGDSLSAYARANADRLGITYIIWWRHIWSKRRDAEGWRPYSGTTNPHTDHVHISFAANAGTGAIIEVPPTEDWMRHFASPEFGGAAQGIGNAFAFATNPRKWWNLLLILIGIILVIMALQRIAASELGLNLNVKGLLKNG